VFVRTKKSRSGTAQHYLVRSYREGGKVRQKVLAYLGEFPTLEAALAGLAAAVDLEREEARRQRWRADHPKDHWQRRTCARYAKQHDKRAAAAQERLDCLRRLAAGLSCPNLET
jgi:hypothetical protein